MNDQAAALHDRLGAKDTSKLEEALAKTSCRQDN